MSTTSTGTQATDSRAVLKVAATAAADKKAHRTVILEVGGVLGITDAFLITSGSNDKQVRTIADAIERAVKEHSGSGPIRTEGLSDARWILLDYGDFIVHVFLEETRQYYDLEHLWADVPRIEFPMQELGRAANA